MKKIKTFETLAQVCNFIETTANAYSIVFENGFIESDAKITTNQLKKVYDNHLCCDEKETPTFFYAPFSFWIGIRTRGVESSERKQEVLGRILDLNDHTLCGMRVDFAEDKFTVTYRRRSELCY